MNNLITLTKITSYLKKEMLFLLLFILIIVFSQTLLLKSHLMYGFSPDDVWLASDFLAIGPNPHLKFPQIWQERSAYVTSPLFYTGILYTLFSSNYLAYQIAALIFKILSIISFYLLIEIIFRNRLLSFFSSLIFSFHYASIGSLEMVARTQDYLLIAGVNIFFILFYLINYLRPKNISWIILTSATFFLSFFINPIRAYPFFPFIVFLGAIIYFRDKSLANFLWIVKTLTIFFLPFILFVTLMGVQGIPYGSFLTNMQKASEGNLQVFLTPFTTIGGLFLVGDGLKFLRPTAWDISNFLSYFLSGPLVILGPVTLFLSIILSKKPIRFFFLVFIINFIFEAILFLMVDNALKLPPELKMNYDAATYAPAAILGIYIIILTIFIFKEWLKGKQNIYFSLYLLGIFYAVNSILFTWLLQDYIYIPLGINGYSTLPSLGISASIAAILVLTYTKLKNNKILKNLAPAVFLILIPYFLLSNGQIQMYFKRYLDSGGMRASDQISMKNLFWNLLQNSKSCNNFFYLYTKDDPQNEYTHSVIMIDRFDRWYSLYGPFNGRVHCPVALLVNDEKKLISSYASINGTLGFLYEDFNEIKKFYPLKDFYAFKLQNKDIIDIKQEVLKKMNEK